MDASKDLKPNISAELLWDIMVSWCSWLSHHAHTVKVAGSNPAETICFACSVVGQFNIAQASESVSSNSYRQCFIAGEESREA